jgi:hypothetical protein
MSSIHHQGVELLMVGAEIDIGYVKIVWRQGLAVFS